jgi:preprotein translocase subunit SecG
MKCFIILVIVLIVLFVAICIFAALANNDLIDDEFQEYEMKRLNENKHKEDK